MEEGGRGRERGGIEGEGDRGREGRERERTWSHNSMGLHE